MKKLKPRPLPREVLIETDDGQELWIDTEINPATGGDLPEPELDVEYIITLWKSKEPGKPSPEVFQKFVELTTEYMVQRDFDKVAAYPGQVNGYVSRVEKAVAALLEVLDPEDPRDQTVLRRITGSAFLVHDLPKSALIALRRNAITLRDEMDQPKQGVAGTKTKNHRQVEFAGKFLEAFGKEEWARGRDENSLAAEMLGACLEAADDPHQSPHKLLSAAGKGAKTQK
jgi:hypothetical protein